MLRFGKIRDCGPRLLLGGSGFAERVVHVAVNVVHDVIVFQFVLRLKVSS